MRGVLGLCWLLVLGCSRTKAGTETQGSGAWLYGRSCAGCHGASGKGGTRPGLGVMAPDLTKPALPLSEAELKRFIREGKAQMPPFAKLLSEAELDAIVQHLHALGREKSK